MSLNILPECFADTELVNALGFKRSNHCQSIGQVANLMRKNYLNKIAIGVIDKDKRTPSYFDNFSTLSMHSGFEVKHLENTQHYLIVIAPALEQFLINLSFELKVPLERFGFSDLNSLKRITKKRAVAQNQNFKNFLNTLRQRNHSPLQVMENEINNILLQN